MAPKNKVEVRIHGRDYTLVGSESEEYIQKVALYIDKKMGEVTKINNKLSTSMTAVLTAINVADDYFKSTDSLDNVRKQVQQYLNELDECTRKLKEYKKENEALKQTIQQYQIELAKKETELETFIETFDGASKNKTVRIDSARKMRVK